MTTRYCQGVGAGPFDVLVAIVRSGSGIPATGQFAGCGTIPTHQARTAISLVLRHWRIGLGDNVLVPSYNCGSEIDPILKSGADVTPYRIDEKLRPDLHDIRRRFTPKTRVIHVTHYFGFPQELAELRRFCDERGVLLLEDCALSLFSRGPEGFVGRIGDAAVFSIPKTLPTPNGGLLVTRRDNISAPCARPHLSRTCRKLLPLFKRWALRQTQLLKVYRLLDRPRGGCPDEQPNPSGRPDIPRSYYFNPATTDWTMSQITRGLVSNIDGDRITDRRRKNYVRLYSEVSNVRGVSPLFTELPPGVCPLGLPIRVRNRSEWMPKLRSSHIDAYAWWSGYHRGINWDEFPEACHFKDEVILLPVHQQLSPRHIDYIGRRVREIAREVTLLEPGS